jgi:hypothetical protein
MLKEWGALRRVQVSKIVRVTKTAVKIELMIPIVSTTANPLIGPVPNWNSTAAAISVVI